MHQITPECTKIINIMFFLLKNSFGASKWCKIIFNGAFFTYFGAIIFNSVH